MAQSLLRHLPEGRSLPDEVWRRRHRGIVVLAFGQAVAIVGYALLRGRTLVAALVEGAIVALPAVLAVVPQLGRTRRAAAATASLVIASTTLVHLSGGVTEAHFHFFVMVGVASLYQDWVPFGVALAIVVVHHGLLGTVRPNDVYATPEAVRHPWLWALLHGGFVLAASLTHLASWRFNEQQGMRDPLTGLPNRSRFAEQVGRGLRNGSELCVLVLDLDDFKTLNERWGGDLGDRVLRTAADRLSSRLRSGDVLARLDGDEFAVLVNGDREVGRQVADALLAALAEPLLVDGHGLVVSVSAGLAATRGSVAAEGTADAPSMTVDALLRNAELAMYAAKASARGRLVVYEDDMGRAWRERAVLIEELAAARGAGQLEVHYQATIRLVDGAITGFEALVRWRHPQRGLVPPLDFIGLAEESGSILDIGEFVLEEAVRQAVTWSRDGDLHMAVNVSPRQLLDTGFPAFVQRTLSENGLPASRLTLEVTEGVLVADHRLVAGQLERLRGLGVQIIDDFGTGYSSLSYLRRLPADVLKIDRSFVSDLHGDPTAVALVAAILDLAASLGLSVIAEGVENGEQAAALTLLGCPEAQGYLYARPQPASELRPLPIPAPRTAGDATMASPVRG
jgi:diguanylate cyclase (GGDEF)-like protein